MGSLLALLGMSFYVNVEQPTPELDPVMQEAKMRFEQQSNRQEPDQYAWLYQDTQVPDNQYKPIPSKQNASPDSSGTSPDKSPM